MLKAGTVAELAAFKEKLSEEIYQRAFNIVSILDNVYGEDRDVDKADGGCIFIVENRDDLDCFSKHYINPDDQQHEVVRRIKSKSCKDYLDLFFLCNNEYGINLFIPVSLAPSKLLKKAPGTGGD